MSPDLSLLVLSYDGNSDMWKPFFQFFDKYWVDRPSKVYLSVNEADFSFNGVDVLKSGTAKDWSSDIVEILKQIDEEYILLLLEDYFIYAPVNTTLIDNSLKVMKELNAGFLRLGTFPARYESLWNSTPLSEYPCFNIVNPDSRYVVNLQAGIWKKNVLESLIVTGESPWSFEINASERFKDKGYISLGLDAVRGLEYVHGPITYLCGALTRGVLMRSAIRLAQKEGILLETGNRPVESACEELGRNIYISLPLPARKIYNAIKSRIRIIFSRRNIKNK